MTVTTKGYPWMFPQGWHNVDQDMDFLNTWKAGMEDLLQERVSPLSPVVPIENMLPSSWASVDWE